MFAKDGWMPTCKRSCPKLEGGYCQHVLLREEKECISSTMKPRNVCRGCGIVAQANSLEGKGIAKYGLCGKCSLAERTIDLMGGK